MAGGRSAWKEECLEKGMTGGRLGWREKSLKQDDEGLNAVRQSALLLLCQMNPDQALSVRGRCVEACRMPGLAVLLTLQHAALALDQEDLITFLSGLLLGTNTGPGFPSSCETARSGGAQRWLHSARSWRRGWRGCWGRRGRRRC